MKQSQILSFDRINIEVLALRSWVFGPAGHILDYSRSLLFVQGSSIAGFLILQVRDLLDDRPGDRSTNWVSTFAEI